jgi:hypothetical protein
MAKNKNEIRFNTVETDYRAEVLASSLIEAGQDASSIHIIREQGDRRGVSKDIDRIKKEYADIGFDPVEYLSIYTNRDGIYDSLPEGVFHQPSGAQRQKYREDVLQDMKEHREKEFFARKYFQPFEMILDRLLIHIRLYEHRYNKPYLYNNLTSIFEEHWEILKLLAPAQALFFIKVIPLMEEIAQSFDLAAKVMEMILDCPVHIREGTQSEHPLIPGDTVNLKNWKLGINTVPGKAVAGDNRDIEIILGPASVEKIKRFLPGEINNRILQSLIEMMIPFDRYLQLKYRVNDAEKKFRLSCDTHKAYLGINTRL